MRVPKRLFMVVSKESHQSVESIGTPVVTVKREADRLSAYWNKVQKDGVTDWRVVPFLRVETP